MTTLFQRQAEFSASCLLTDLDSEDFTVQAPWVEEWILQKVQGATAECCIYSNGYILPHFRILMNSAATTRLFYGAGWCRRRGYSL